MFASGFLLTRPWGLHSGEDRDRHRIELRPGQAHVVVPAGCGLSVIAPSRLGVRLSGRRTLTAQCEGGAFLWNGEKRFWTVPVGSGPEEARAKLLIEAESGVIETIDIAVIDAPSRPKQPGETDVSERLLSLVLAIVERIRSLIDDEPEAVQYRALGRKLISAIVPWDLAVRKWCEAYDADRPPPLDLIVRHAEALQRTVETLASHPRRVLKRKRDLLPVSRIQEMDPGCLQWYVRQPGRSVAEKAGSRQRLLAVAREESFDTLENQVLRAYVALAALAARSYTELHRKLRESDRMRLVSRFGHLCRVLDRELADVGIRKATGFVTPNYVLTQDARYRSIWEGYQQLLRRELEEDDLWRWQTRLWAEFVRLSILVAVHRMPTAQISAAVPMQVRADQERGSWADLAAHPAVARLVIDEHQYALTVIDAQHPSANQFGPSQLWSYFWSIGPACVLHAQDLETDEETWVLIWGLHPIGGQAVDLRAEAESADHALGTLGRRIREEGGGHHRLRGLILVSAQGAISGRNEGACGETVSYRCPVDPESLSGTVNTLVEMLPVVLGA